MTVSSTLNKHVYTGNGSTTSFPFTFRVLNQNELKLYLTTISTSTDTQVTSNFTVSPSGGTFPSDSGTITYPTTGTALASTHKLTIIREVDPLQPTVYPNNTALKPKVIETSLDRLTMIVQQQKEQIDRSVKTTISSNSAADMDSLRDYANQATTSKDAAAISATSAAASATTATTKAAEASVSAANAFAATAPAWSSTTTYNYPTVVAYTDGYSYRCIGTNIVGDIPSTSINWVRIAIVSNDFFDIDTDGGLMPALSQTYSADFELDNNGDITPKK